MTHHHHLEQCTCSCNLRTHGSTNLPLDQLHHANVGHDVDRGRTSSPQTLLDISSMTIPEFTDISPTHEDRPLSTHSYSPPIDRTGSPTAGPEHAVLLDPFDRKLGVEAIFSCDSHTLLLTYSGEVYGWGWNYVNQIIHKRLLTIKSPIKLPIHDIVTISAGHYHSLALSSDGKLYGWGETMFYQTNMSSSLSLPITPIHIPYNIKEVYCGSTCSFALTQEGQVVKWGNGKSFELIKGLSNIVSLSLCDDSFVAVDENGDFFFLNKQIKHLQIIPMHFTPKQPFQGSFYFDDNCLLVIDVNDEVWRFNVDDDPFNNKPTKVEGLSNIVFISGYDGIYAALDNNGKVFVWGLLSRISDFWEDSDEPRCIEAFTNIEGISVGRNFLFAYNKNTVWAWGRNNEGQLATGDLIDRPQPVKVFGSEVFGSFDHPKEPMDSMFSGLIKLIYFEYLQYLKNLFGNHPYTKVRFYTKSSISKKVAKFAQEVINGLEFITDPQDFNLNENICDLKLRLSTDCKGLRVINTRIKNLDVYYDEVDYDQQLLSFFPHVEVVKLGGESRSNRRLNLAQLSNLKCLELDYNFDIEQLPTSLVKLVLSDYGIKVTDLSYLTSLKELVLQVEDFAEFIITGQVTLPQSLVRLAVSFDKFLPLEIKLPNLKELIIEGIVFTNITEQTCPQLNFIQLMGRKEFFFEYRPTDSPLSPVEFVNKGLIKSVKLIKNEYLVELSCFPWWIQYSANEDLVNIFRHYLHLTH
ncbi:hypothetical protein P9112_014367 [Eukaryota sp. TZLM1-RC]